MMIGVRPRGDGFVVGTVYERMRHEKPAAELRRARYVGSSDELPEVLQRVLAQASEPESVPHLHKDDHYALTLLKRRGSLTQWEYKELTGKERLAARIHDLRRVYGRDAIETVHEKNPRGGWHGRYFWRGSRR